MTSVVSGGTADRIIARVLIKVLRAGSGTLSIYSSTFFEAAVLLLTFFISVQSIVSIKMVSTFEKT